MHPQYTFHALYDHHQERRLRAERRRRRHDAAARAPLRPATPAPETPRPTTGARWTRPAPARFDQPQGQGC